MVEQQEGMSWAERFVLREGLRVKRVKGGGKNRNKTGKVIRVPPPGQLFDVLYDHSGRIGKRCSPFNFKLLSQTKKSPLNET